MATGSFNFKSGEEFRRQKELEEARKAGLAPAELDEDGKEINPHIPQYMTSAPWYLNTDHPTLKHQRDWRNKDGDSKQWYDRGVKTFQATKWRPGACENCGSMTHKTKDCLERPRQKSAKLTNKNIAADEKVQELQIIGFDAKRDRWNGYEAKEYSKVVDRYEKIEAMRQEQAKKEQMAAAYHQGAATAVDGDAGASGSGAPTDDSDKIADEEEVAFGEVKQRVRTAGGGASGSVRNLRIREDTAKYLLNLDVNSAYYDPKSRSMREDPNPEKPADEKLFAGDNVVRRNGEFQQWQALNLHSMAAFDKGQDVHLQAVPSLAETLYKSFKAKKDTLQKTSKTEVLERYGNIGESAPEEALLLGQTEAYVEYDRSGRLIKGQEVKARSKFEEDVYINNHTAVWGSWWHDGTWGFACCHSTSKNSYCVGQAGLKAAEVAERQMEANMEAKAARQQEEREQEEREAEAGTSGRGAPKATDVWGEARPDSELDPAKVKEAMEKLAAQEKAAVDGDTRKRSYNSVGGPAAAAAVTEEDMEAYRLKKGRSEDPMARAQAASAAAGGYDFV